MVVYKILISREVIILSIYISLLLIWRIIDGGREVIHYSDVDKLLCCIDDIKDCIDVHGSPNRAQLRRGTLEKRNFTDHIFFAENTLKTFQVVMKHFS